jgi:hypothetical protein
MTNSTISLRQFVEYVARRAEYLFKKQGALSPMYHAVDAEGNNYVLPGPPGTKDQAVAQVRSFLKACRAVRVAFIDEAWVIDAERSPGVDVEKIYREAGSIRNHPARVEVVIVSGEDAKEGLLMATREIIRHGDKAALGRLKFIEYGQTEGRMVGLLPTTTTKH